MGCGVTRRHARWGGGGEGRTGHHQRITGCSGGLAHLAAWGFGEVAHRQNEICRNASVKWLVLLGAFPGMQARAGGSADGRDGGIIPAAGGRG